MIARAAILAKLSNFAVTVITVCLSRSPAAWGSPGPQPATSYGAATLPEHKRDGMQREDNYNLATRL
jgi:hypothetical protein